MRKGAGRYRHLLSVKWCRRLVLCLFKIRFDLNHDDDCQSPDPIDYDCSRVSTDEIDPFVSEYVTNHRLEKMVMTKDARTGLFQIDFNERLALGQRRLSNSGIAQTEELSSCESALARLKCKKV
jgi:hypothetical protein